MANKNFVEKLAVICLAAGRSTRMKSKFSKLVMPLCGRPMIGWTLRAADELRPQMIIPVAGHLADAVKAAVSASGLRSPTKFALQNEQKGTAHAVAAAQKVLGSFSGNVLIIYGDMPLLETKSYRRFIAAHKKSGATLSVLTAIMDPTPHYGRIIRENGHVARIVEHKDVSAAERKITEINTGVYLIKADFLRRALKKIGNKNKQGEYYLTDIVGIAAAASLNINGIILEDPDEAQGINDRVELAAAEAVLRKRILEQHMLNGVTIADPASTFIDAGIKIAPDVTIGHGVHILGSSKIEEDVTIEAGCHITDCAIGRDSHIYPYSVMEQAKVGPGCSVGPFARLRPGTRLVANVKIGNFVETKKSVLGDGVKASHLTYLGDAEIGADSNIGCGTITCNYDGALKHKTKLGKGVFVGSDAQFVAPVTVGDGAYIAAGATVTDDVPADALAISRAPQRNIEGWAKKKHAKLQAAKKSKKK